MRRTILVLCFFCFLAMHNSHAQGNQPIKLYPGSIPNSKPAPAGYVQKNNNNMVSMVTEPTLTPFIPEKDKANGTAVVICPGGGYSGLATGHEGYDVARKFNEIGVAAFVLIYRLPSDDIMNDKSIGPLQDVQRAVQFLHQRANDWGIDTAKIGVVGFSAGGHLASMAITHFRNAVIDNKEGINLRPAFGILIYPAITFGPEMRRASKTNLLGKNPSTEKMDFFSTEKQVTAATPPAFIVHAQDDKSVPVANSIMFFEAMVKAGVKGEMHLYQAGGHGFGLINKTTRTQWFDVCTRWMDANGWLAAK
ncbi:prolyl oligopeptidase family serine peptidase [Mucilaginibacter sp. HME9299]|uniref:Prolyl oligopeptidase family serine peptidase n=2 Tax=Mucilaginibacter aquatilis TaxID=1517760 RepID=A0A6I4IRC3_9SPHI|nr:prolyl oligopeptidase family serine peptidase [Mucilaginibacter aquatilis]